MSNTDRDVYSQGSRLYISAATMGLWDGVLPSWCHGQEMPLKGQRSLRWEGEQPENMVYIGTHDGSRKGEKVLQKI